VLALERGDRDSLRGGTGQVRQRFAHLTRLRTTTDDDDGRRRTTTPDDDAGRTTRTPD
jgi:hypothetical protein